MLWFRRNGGSLLSGSDHSLKAKSRLLGRMQKREILVFERVEKLIMIVMQSMKNCIG